ncbi:MAG: ADP-ribosylglycohydrolase family protein [Acidobacteria bacterium]|nr:ADP-ribosylglycohydrolase family protein [Acidobacteriota bacterium]
MSTKQVVALFSMLVVAGTSACTEKTPERRLSRAVLEDKVRGGWAGQMIGVAYGGPTEFRSNGRIIEGEIEWSPEMIESTIDQDDLYVEMTFAEVMDGVGLEATTEQYGDMFRDSEYRLWHANAGARRNLNRGIKAPMSGHPTYNIHANDIDFQIESDFIGLMTPGLPQEANKYADRVGRVMNYGDGLYGGMFVSGMYAAGFFETDPRKVVEEGLKSIPAGSGYAQVIADVLAWHGEHPADWKTTWTLLEEKWDGDDMCPDGALAPFNIDARLNGAYIALGLLYGEGDFARTLEISTRSGQDSDCNPSSAAGVLGVMMGYEAIPDEFKSGIPAIEDEKFSYTQYSFNDIVDSTMKRAQTIIEGAGGRVTDTEVVIPLQSPAPLPLEQWDADPPIARVQPDDPAWEWTGPWMPEAIEARWGQWNAKQTTEAGAEATFTFQGTGVALVGRMTQEGGRADVYLDGEKSDYVLDAWIPERTHDNDYWHVTGLEAGEHTLRIVVREDADERSNGRTVQIQAAVVYGKEIQ